MDKNFVTKSFMDINFAACEKIKGTKTERKFQGVPAEIN